MIWISHNKVNFAVDETFRKLKNMNTVVQSIIEDYSTQIRLEAALNMFFADKQ